MKRKKTAVAHNRKSGNSPTPVPFEDEVQKICWLDDSLEPADLWDSHGVVSKKVRDRPPPSTASLFSQGSSDNNADEPASVLDDSQPSAPQGSADSVEKRLNAKTAQVSTARAQEVKLFSEEMEHVQKLKEQQKAAREEERRQRHEEKKYREEMRKEKAERHEQKMELLKWVLGLLEVSGRDICACVSKITFFLRTKLCNVANCGAHSFVFSIALLFQVKKVPYMLDHGRSPGKRLLTRAQATLAIPST